MKKIAFRMEVSVFSLMILMILIATTDVMAFRCGEGIVDIGDSKTKVLITCGKPVSKEKVSSKKKEVSKSRRDKATGYTVTKKTGKKLQGVEKWYYNCGEEDFLYALTFEDGVLQKEETEGRGKGKSECKGK